MERYTFFTINDVTLVDSCQFMLSSLDKLSSNLNKDQFRDTKMNLETFYAEQRNHPQTNNVAEGREESEFMHVHEDYRNHPYHWPTLTLDQQ